MPSAFVSNFSNSPPLLETPAADEFCRPPSLANGADAADGLASSDDEVESASDELDVDESADVSTSVEPAIDGDPAPRASPPLPPTSSLSEFPLAHDGASDDDCGPSSPDSATAWRLEEEDHLPELSLLLLRNRLPQEPNLRNPASSPLPSVQTPSELFAEHGDVDRAELAAGVEGLRAEGASAEGDLN